MIRLLNVSKFYYSKGVIASGFTKVNLEFKIGEFVAITGESGSGKSTLLNVISGLDTYEEGEMYINGLETSHYIEKDWEIYRRKNIGNIYQNFNLINSYTVYQNIELSLTLNGISKKLSKEKVNSLIKRVGLWKFRNTKVSKLSGGQKQRVAIARALAKEVPIIIADEPTASLDVKSANEVIELLSSIAKDKLVIIVTHNYEQVAKYVTRKITMHDGKILEDKKIKVVDEVDNYYEASLKNINWFQKIRLGFRNTFNVIPKFILLFLVYAFIVCALMGEYTAFKEEEYVNSKGGYNVFFRDTSDTRIVVKKGDKSSFSRDDLEKIKKIGNVSYVLENDLMADRDFQMATKDHNLWVSGLAKSISTFEGKVDIGRMPKSDDEIVILGMKNDYYLGRMRDELLNNTFYFVDNNTGDVLLDNVIKIVGIKYLDKDDYRDYTLYFSDNYLKKMLFNTNIEYSKVVVNFMNKNYKSEFYNNYFKVEASDNVEKGSVFVNSDLNSSCDKGNCLNKTLSINVDNLYYNETHEFNISKLYNKNNIDDLLGLDSYDEKDFYSEYSGKIYINRDDYNSLFNKDTYQISVYAKDHSDVPKIASSLEKMGYDSLTMSSTLVNGGEVEFVRILKIVLTLGLVITLFFISYFIIRLILKSRNGYFSVIRMLGASKNVCRELLIIELFIVSNIAYFLFVFILFLERIGIFSWEFLTLVNNYLLFSDYLLLYVIISLMSILVSVKYSKKLFKVSVMNAYREEV